MVKVRITDDGYAKMNLSLGVGPGRANNIDDVTYVQYLLNHVIQHPKFISAKLSCKKNGAKLVVDGLIGPKTKLQITAFQMHFRNAGWGNFVDGCVDTLKGILTPTNKFYTLSLFDWAIMEIADPNVVDTNSLTKRSDFPPRLKTVAMRIQAING